MSTDYGPEGILSDALSEAGVNGSFKLKDSVFINPDAGEVKQSQVRSSSRFLYFRAKQTDVQEHPGVHTAKAAKKGDFGVA